MTEQPMAFLHEQDLKSHLRRLIKIEITSKHPHDYTLDNKKAVDIVVCRDGEQAALFFIEVKLFKASSNRLGVGTGGGTGYQPEILSRRPAYFESHLRWVIVDSNQLIPSYWFIPTSTLLGYMAAEEVGTKQNNIRRRIFRNISPMNETELVDAFCIWFLS